MPTFKLKNMLRRLSQVVSCMRVLEGDANYYHSRRIDLSDSKQREIMSQVNLTALQQRQGFQEVTTFIQIIINRLNQNATGTLREAQQTRDVMEEMHREEISQRQLKELLDSLYFPAIFSRAEKIEEAYSNTFSWIFDDSEAAVRPWDNFVRWLREGEKTYWINGKAGSGKSTLMSYMLGSLHLRNNLRSWSDVSQQHPRVLNFGSVRLRPPYSGKP